MRGHFFHYQYQWLPILKKRPLMLFLDYDGTLTPIVKNPSLARLAPETRKMIQRLSKINEIKIAVISGRSLKDLKSKVRIPGIIYAGNHGFEIKSPKIRYVHPGALSTVKILNTIDRKLHSCFKATSGLFIENKKFTLSIHYRQMNPGKVPQVKKILMSQISSYLKKKQIALTEGKKVWEIRPNFQWGKGKTVLWFLAKAIAEGQKQTLPIYIGDDQTDEDAFKALRQKGITIKVTKSSKDATSADYYLPSFRDVLKFLGQLEEIKDTPK